jgi:hypothetical protein
VPDKLLPRLTTSDTGAIFPAMRPADPLSVLKRALLLVLVGFGFVFAAGAAFAHGGSHESRPETTSTTPAAHHAHDQQAVQHEAAGHPVSTDQTAGGEGESAPCPRDHAPDHPSKNCCNIACHAALPATPMDPVGALEPQGNRIAGLVDLLVGHLTGRTERPPRLG